MHLLHPREFSDYQRLYQVDINMNYPFKFLEHFLLPLKFEFLIITFPFTIVVRIFYCIYCKIWNNFKVSFSSLIIIIYLKTYIKTVILKQINTLHLELNYFPPYNALINSFGRFISYGS